LNEASPGSAAAVPRGDSKLKQRLLSTLLIVPPLVCGLAFLPSAVSLSVVIVLSSLMILEFYRVLDRANIPAFRFFGACCGGVLILATYLGFRWNPADGPTACLARATEWESLALAFTVLVLMVRQFPQKHNDKPLPTIACTLLGVMYIPFLLNSFVKLGLTESNVGWRTPLFGHAGFYLIFYAILVAKCTDAGAFFSGLAFGRHKLFPRLSPAKTWEGLVGGIVTGVVVSLVFFRLTEGKLGSIRVDAFHATILGVLLSIVATMSDLTESLIKRAADVRFQA
jgi:phosphatidate cytidylyltransferase